MKLSLTEADMIEARTDTVLVLLSEHERSEAPLHHDFWERAGHLVSQTGGPAGRAAYRVRAGHQPESRAGTVPKSLLLRADEFIE